MHILEPNDRWECPNCTATHVQRCAPNMFPYHDCRGMKGLSVPFVPAGQDCKVEALEREDYVGGEQVRYDGEGRPIMSVVTTRADGSNDCAVFAPTARTSAAAP